MAENTDLIDYDGVRTFLPHLKYSQLMYLSKTSQFPEFVRIGGPRGRPVWRKSAVVAWINSKLTLLVAEEANGIT